MVLGYKITISLTKGREDTYTLAYIEVIDGIIYILEDQENAVEQWKCMR